jgi:predicted nucleic acid-binding protein
MVLVDTSVWVAHLSHGTIGLEALLTEAQVVCHPFIIGELACGHLQYRKEILINLKALPQAILAGHAEVMQFIEIYRRLGLGLGYIDMHLLASALLTHVPLWTLDQRLHEVAVRLKLAP